MLLGGFLVVFMAVLGVSLAGVIAGSNEPGTGARFTGGPEGVALIVLIFGLVISFGLAAVAGGIWQVIFAKRNKVIMVVMFLFAGLLFVIGALVRGLT
jgi:hypothetical protein